MMKTTKKLHLFNIGMLAIMNILSAVSAVLMLFEKPLGFAPGFYKIDLSEVPVLIGTFALGPLAGTIIELLKILLNFIFSWTITVGIGELANFIIGCTLVVRIYIASSIIKI